MTTAARPVPKPRPRRRRSQRPTGPTPSTQLVVRRRAGGRCERCALSILACGSEIHHRTPRGMGGTSSAHINAPSNLVVLCPDCHRHIERHREHAVADGWLIQHRGDPTAIAVQSRLHGRVLLADDGTTITPADEERL